MRALVAIKDDSSSSSRSADTSIKLSPAEWEMAKRIATVLYDDTVNDLFERAVVEKCIAAGVIAVPDKRRLSMPKSSESVEAALKASAAFAGALAQRITDVKGTSTKTWEKRVFFLRPKTRAHLVKQLALFPRPLEFAFEAPPYQPDGEAAPTVTKIRLRPMHMTAAKAAANELYGGNLSALIHRALEDKANALGMDKKGVHFPTFEAYPSTSLLALQRNIEEPALALIAGLEVLAPRLPAKRSKLVDELRVACDALFEALLSLVPPETAV